MMSDSRCSMWVREDCEIMVRPAPFGSAQGRLRSRPIYGVPPGLGVGDGLLLSARCGVTAGEEPHPVKPLPAF